MRKIVIFHCFLTGCFTAATTILALNQAYKYGERNAYREVDRILKDVLVKTNEEIEKIGKQISEDKDWTNEWLHKTYSVEPIIGHDRRRPRLVCKDGYSVSIQANEFTYCVPQENGDIDYKCVELGFPSECDDLITEYAEDENYTETVYGYVPVDVVNKLIIKHGGIDYEKSIKEAK